jgi:putative flippase GtrA
MSERARLIIVAIVGAAIGWLTYELVYFLNPLAAELRPTTSWLVAFTVGVARQHALHRRFTFASEAPYWASLGRAYRHYAGVAAIGSVLDYTLTTLGVPHRLAWLACLAVTATFGVVFLRSNVFAAKHEPHEPHERSEHGTKQPSPTE